MRNLDITSLSNIGKVSKQWKVLAEDAMLWKELFHAEGWKSNTISIDHYLSDYGRIESISSLEIADDMKSIPPLAITTASLYDPNTLPKMPGTPIKRLKPFKRSTDLFLDKILRTQQHGNRSSNIDSNQDNLPPQQYPSKSQSCSHINYDGEALSHTIIERHFINRPSPKGHIKNDETAIFHYKENHDIRYINWKRLYKNRATIEKRWQEGKCKTRQFPPPPIATRDILSTIEQQHHGGIYCLQFNHSILVTGSRDRNLKIWDIKSGLLNFTLEGHLGSVLCLQFDSRYLITGSSDSTLIVWDIHTGEKIKTLVGHAESVLNVKFNENTVVSCSKDRTIRAWNLETGALKMTLRGHRAAVNAVQFKDNIIVSASGDRTIKIWNMASWNYGKKYWFLVIDSKHVYLENRRVLTDFRFS